MDKKRHIKIALKRIFSSYNSKIVRKEVFLGFKKWEENVPAAANLALKLEMAVEILGRYASYRQVFPAFEAMFTAASLRHVEYGTMLLRNVTSRSDTCRLMRGLR